MSLLQSLYLSHRPDQAAHDTLVRRTAAAMRAAGIHDVQADVAGYVTPTKIVWVATQKGHVPDLLSAHEIVEVETADSISSPHTEEQCRLFAAYASQHRKRFTVVVPVGYKLRMQVQLVLIWGIYGVRVIEM